MAWQVVTSSPEETESLGRLLGSLLERPTAIFLAGDLGAGKTCLTRGSGQASLKMGMLRCPALPIP